MKPEYVPVPDSGEDDRSFASAGQSFRLADHPRNSYYAAYWALGPAVSQIGGYPAWIQDGRLPFLPLLFPKHDIHRAAGLGTDRGVRGRHLLYVPVRGLQGYGNSIPTNIG
ncbi:Uncharacterised protein [Actinobacillus pleuropneumoniae]|nr:Uncharacterised protein [Actinobacillus pleuropneumoniae]